MQWRKNARKPTRYMEPVERASGKKKKLAEYTANEKRGKTSNYRQAQ